MSDIVTPLTLGSNAAPALTFNTASIAPGNNRLVLLAVAVSWVASQGTPPAQTITFNGTGLTFEPIRASGVEYWQDGATANEWGALYLYRALGAAVTAGTITIAAPVDMDDAAWSVVEVDHVDTSGTNGSGAIVQSAESTGAGVNTLLATLAAFSSPNNITYGAFGHSDIGAVPRTHTPGAGFTELHDTGVAYSGIGTQWRPDNDTTVDTTLSATASGVGGIAIEIKIAPVPAKVIGYSGFKKHKLRY